jgi:pimeloyl-ACP methyl ester carboxylesterase
MDFFNKTQFKLSGKYNGYSIIFFHGHNHSAFNYNYKYINGFKRDKSKFLDYLEHLSTLFIYDRPEEMLRFNVLRGKDTYIKDYYNVLKETSPIWHVKILEEFLRLKNVKPPYVLIGHGTGCIYALRFANAFKEKTKGIYLMEPYHLNPRTAMSSLGNKLNNEKLLENLQNLNNETLKKLEAHTIAAPAFPIKFTFPVRCYFKLKEGDKKLVREQDTFKKYLKDNNPENLKCFTFSDKGGMLNETNPLGLAYNIKYDIQGRR